MRVVINVTASRSKSANPVGRSQRRGQETREKVIQAAAACVAEEGFASANTNRIVERAGVTWGVLQHHFGDKSGLLDAVLERGMNELEAGFDALVIEGDDVNERVVQVVDAGWKIFTGPLSLASNEIEVNTRAPRADDPSHVESLLRMNQRLEHLVLSALREALGRKPSRGVYGAFLLALRGFALTSMMTRLEPDFRNERKALAKMIVEASR
jgi:AcrR family transcriptional regulator